VSTEMINLMHKRFIVERDGYLQLAAERRALEEQLDKTLIRMNLMRQLLALEGRNVEAPAQSRSRAKPNGQSQTKRVGPSARRSRA
jgi:hypothetical protein